MIRIYGMSTCPDCIYVEEQVKGDSQYEVIDIGAHVKNLKEFMRLRDNNPAFDVMKRVGAIGIACFILEKSNQFCNHAMFHVYRFQQFLLLII